MRRFILFSILVFSVLFSINADTSPDTKSQIVSGYIGRWVKCIIEDVHYGMNGGNGINLNINDQNNNERYLIAPTQVALTKPGLIIGRLSIVSSTSQIVLHITPGVLVNQNNNNITYDYELAVSYILETEASQSFNTQICKSGGTMNLDFENQSGVVIVDNAGIYFRLCTEVKDAGVYESTVVFSLEAKQ